jgi:hypothetical protein
MKKAAIAVQRFGAPYDGDRWYCAEKRPLAANSEQPPNPNNNHLYRQIVSGAFGAGQILNIALRMARARKSGVVKTESAPIPPAHVLASIVAKAAQRKGIVLANHQDCKGEAGAETINLGIAANSGPRGEDVFETIKPHYANTDGKRADLSRSRFEFIGSMVWESLADGMIAEIDDVRAKMDGGHADAEPIHRVPVANTPHNAEHFIINWKSGQAYDTHSALAASEEGDSWLNYHVTLGDVDELYGAAAALFPEVTYTDFRDVAYVVNAAASLWLPENPELHAEY